MSNDTTIEQDRAAAEAQPIITPRRTGRRSIEQQILEKRAARQAAEAKAAADTIAREQNQLNARRSQYVRDLWVAIALLHDHVDPRSCSIETRFDEDTKSFRIEIIEEIEEIRHTVDLDQLIRDLPYMVQDSGDSMRLVPAIIRPDGSRVPAEGALNSRTL